MTIAVNQGLGYQHKAKDLFFKTRAFTTKAKVTIFGLKA